MDDEGTLGTLLDRFVALDNADDKAEDAADDDDGSLLSEEAIFSFVEGIISCLPPADFGIRLGKTFI